MKLLQLLLTLLTSASATPPATHPYPDSPDIVRGRQLTQWILAGRIDSLFPRFSPAFQLSVGGLEGFRTFVSRVSQLGPERELIDEAVYHENGQTLYYRISRFDPLPSVTILWAWDSTGAVSGLLITPTPQAAPTEYADYTTRTPLRLPFAGRAYVRWGGRTPHQNYHVIAPDQRFAYDFLLLRNGADHTGSGTRNEDYACFGTPVLAPAPGTVVTAVDTVPDNRQPGTMNPAAPPGNYVVIDHGDGEFSLLAHLKHGSVAVDSGQKVAAGERVGLCGNSGNSSAPHLHYHLQTGPAFGDGVGLPARFRHYLRNGKAMTEGEPVRGDTVEAAP